MDDRRGVTTIISRRVASGDGTLPAIDWDAMTICISSRSLNNGVTTETLRPHLRPLEVMATASEVLTVVLLDVVQALTVLAAEVTVVLVMKWIDSGRSKYGMNVKRKLSLDP